MPRSISPSFPSPNTCCANVRSGAWSFENAVLMASWEGSEIAGSAPCKFCMK